MIGCPVPDGYIKTVEGRTLPPRAKRGGDDDTLVASQALEEGDVLWTERLFLFAFANAGPHRLLVLTEDTVWNQMCSMIWNTLLSKGAEKVEAWSVGFSALARALLSSKSTESPFLIEPQTISTPSETVAVALATFLVKAILKHKGYTPYAALPAAWLLIAFQRNHIPLREDGTSADFTTKREGKATLECFLPFSRMAAPVPMRSAANAILSVEGVTATGQVELRCTATRAIAEGRQIRLHLHRTVAASVDAVGTVKDEYNELCNATEKCLLGMFRLTKE